MAHKALLQFSAVILIGALFLGGCTSKSAGSVFSPKQPISIEIWHYYNGPQKNVFDKMVNEFNETAGAKRGIVVEAFSQGTADELSSKIINAGQKKVGAGQVPNIFAAYADTAYAIDRLGMVASLDSLLNKKELAEYVPGYLEEGRFSRDGKLKIFPIAKSTEVLMLNKTDWDKFAAGANVSVKDLKTIEGVTAVAQKYYEWTDSRTAQLNDGKAFFGRDALSNYFLIGSMQLGKELFEVKDGTCTLNLDKEIVRKLWDNYYVPYMNGWFCANGKFRTDDIKVGDIIAMVGSTSCAAYFPEKVAVTDTKSYPIDSLTLEAPAFAGGKRYAIQQGAGMVVTKSDPRTEKACAVFLKWLTETERNMNFVAQSGYLPVKIAANDQKMLKSLDFKQKFSAGLQQTLFVGIQTVHSNSMYSVKAFPNGMNARKILEKSMTDQLKQDMVKMEAGMQTGLSRKEAATKFTTDANFEDWYIGFAQNLQKAVQ